jgi:syntaxin 16
MNLPPGWVDISDQVSADMQQARSKMAELAKAHSRALMPSFDDTSKQERAIEFLSQQITKQLSRPTGPSEQDANIRKNVQVSINY